MIRSCESSDVAAILAVVNDASEAYRGVVPADCWKDPYMAEEELRREMAGGVEFYGWEEDDAVLAVMGLQHVGTAALIRHAYTRTADQGRGLGGRLLAHLRGLGRAPLLVGTWADATWAIRFYERRGFRLVPPEEKDRFLRAYWSVPERQMEVSVVLIDRSRYLPVQAGDVGVHIAQSGVQVDQAVVHADENRIHCDQGLVHLVQFGLNRRQPPIDPWKVLDVRGVLLHRLQSIPD
jgi:GNAT superfamily N-acetyltransferase